MNEFVYFITYTHTTYLKNHKISAYFFCVIVEHLKIGSGNKGIVLDMLSNCSLEFYDYTLDF